MFYQQCQATKCGAASHIKHSIFIAYDDVGHTFIHPCRENIVARVVDRGTDEETAILTL